MSAGRSVERQFGEKQRVLLEKLFRSLGTDNQHEAAEARAAIHNLLRQFGHEWSDLLNLLGGRPTLRADLAHALLDQGLPDEAGRIRARSTIADILAHHRKNWNDLADVLCLGSGATWA